MERIGGINRQPRIPDANPYHHQGDFEEEKKVEPTNPSPKTRPLAREDRVDIDPELLERSHKENQDKPK